MELFSGLHVSLMLATWLFAVYCGRMRRYAPGSPPHRILAQVIFWSVLCGEIFWTYFRQAYLNIPWQENLPLHISDFCVIALFFGLQTRRRIFSDILCFAGIPITVLATTLPALQETGGLAILSAFRFYLMHAGMLGGAVFLTLGQSYFPDFRAMARTYLITLIYGLSMIPVNRILGSNYFYTQHPPASVTKFLVNLPWPEYFIGACLFFLFWFVLMAIVMRFAKEFSSQLDIGKGR